MLDDPLWIVDLGDSLDVEVDIILTREVVFLETLVGVIAELWLEVSLSPK